jgi:hypothetical protein
MLTNNMAVLSPIGSASRFSINYDFLGFGPVVIGR